MEKLFKSGKCKTQIAKEAKAGVKNECLKVLESDTTSVLSDYGKYIPVPIGNTLFVCAGAFNNEPNVTRDKLRECGVKTEFLGRVGLVYNSLEQCSPQWPCRATVYTHNLASQGLQKFA